jgi:hypothetical protein
MSHPKYEIRDGVTTSVVYRDGVATDLRHVRDARTGAVYDVNHPEIRISVGVGEIWAVVRYLKDAIRDAERAAPDPRMQDLKSEVVDGRLVISIGLDELDAMRRLLRVDFDRVSNADIADMLVNVPDLLPGRAPYTDTPFEFAVAQAASRAKMWDDHNESTTEPSTEFVR